MVLEKIRQSTHLSTAFAHVHRRGCLACPQAESQLFMTFITDTAIITGLLATKITYDENKRILLLARFTTKTKKIRPIWLRFRKKWQYKHKSLKN